MVIAVSLPMTCAATWRTTSGMHRVDLARHDRGALLQLGQEQLADARARARAHQRRSFAILVSDTATTLSAPDSSTSASRLRLRLEGVGGRAIVRPVARRGACARPRRTRGACSGRCRWRCRRAGSARPAQRAATRSRAEADLRRVAAELLAERHGHGVHQVRAAGLDDVGELLGLGGQRGLELVERGQQLVRASSARRGARPRGRRRWTTGPC